jgi:hypothetical protein
MAGLLRIQNLTGMIPPIRSLSSDHGVFPIGRCSCWQVIGTGRDLGAAAVVGRV